MKIYTIEAWQPNQAKPGGVAERYEEDAAIIAAREMVAAYPQHLIYIHFLDRSKRVNCYFNPNGKYEITGVNW